MNDDEVRRRFTELTAGMSAADLMDLAGAIARHHIDEVTNPGRPELRHPQRDHIATFRIRADIDGEKPPIWRRLDVRSTITLDVLHDVLQAAFGWADEHLYRFALGGGVWDRHSQIFLCPCDVDDPETSDDGMPAREVRIDEVFAEPGDTMRYVYDYGDEWRVTLRLERITDTPADIATPIARCIDGRRAAPPEGSRGLEGEDLRSILPDPTRFDPADVNNALADVRFRMREAGVLPEVISVIDRLRYALDPDGPTGTDPEEPDAFTDPVIARAANALAEPDPPVDDAEREASLRAWTWFLRRAGSEGIPLTAAGYLKPADVADAARHLPTSDAWLTTSAREIDNTSLLHFRESLVRQGFLRKYKGRLLVTRIGASARTHPDRLWQVLVDRWRGVVAATQVLDARAGSRDADFVRDATICTLLAVAAGESFHSSWGAQVPGGLDRAARWLSRLGWSTDGAPVAGQSLYAQPVRTVLENLWDGPRDRTDKGQMSATARRFAREVLRRP